MIVRNEAKRRRNACAVGPSPTAHREDAASPPRHAAGTRARRRTSWARGGALLLLATLASIIPITSALQARLPQNHKGRGPPTDLRKSKENYIVDADELNPSPSSLMASSARDDKSGGGGRGGKPKRADYARGRTATVGGAISPLLLTLRDQKNEVQRHVREKRLFKAVDVIESMIESMNQIQSDSQKRSPNGARADDGAGNVHAAASGIIDEAVQAVVNRAFAPPYGSGKKALERISLGLEAMDLQLSPGATRLSSPYNTIPRSTWLNALRALTGVAGRRPRRCSGKARRSGSSPPDPAGASYRVLQRLITGRGVRPPAGGSLDERDFSMVLNAFVSSGRMEMAHRIVALQERTERAPPLSPVAYSILVKGYGRRGDAENIEMILSHAKKNAIAPDTIMYNSLIDAYVNCGMIDKAYGAFCSLVDGRGADLSDGPRPNVRTYNTMLKGFAKSGDLRKALKLSDKMKAAGLWDDITTNTLVNVAVKAEEFEMAEEILNNHTGTFRDDGRRGGQRATQKHERRHPNVEAYTEIIDGYAKAGSLDKALRMLQLMRKRHVAPNQYTYTSVVGAMARAGKVVEAKRMLDFMSSDGVSPTVVTYNALITGMLAAEAPPPTSAESSDDDGFVSEEQAAYNARVVDALGLLNRMIKSNVPPDPITASSIVEGMGRCRPARLSEARAVLTKLRGDGMVSADNERVGTALIRACAFGGDFRGAVSAFRGISNPDVVSFNAFLDSCCRCGRDEVAFEAFRKLIGRAAGTSSVTKTQATGTAKLKPDVITFTILISSLLKMETLRARKRVYRLYREMRSVWGIAPDAGLVDVILEATIRGGSLGLSRENVQFTANVLKDAEAINWGRGELEKRKRAVRGIIIGRIGEVWKGKGDDYSADPGQEDMDDPLFAMKGWNKVDSGFRLWGAPPAEESAEDGRRSDSENRKDVDEFLDSHGWNDVNSGFRLF